MNKYSLLQHDYFYQAMENPVHIYIFKTNLNQPSDISRVEPALQRMSEISRWSVDCEDPDKVLRVVTTRNEPGMIVDQLHMLGYQCEELAE